MGASDLWARTQLAASASKFANLQPLNLETLGAVPGQDSTIPLTAMFSSGNADNYIPAGAFIISSFLTVSGAGRRFRGVPGQTIITSPTIENLILLGTCSDIVFEDIIFQTTLVSGTNNIFGLIWCDDSQITNITFLRCEFTSPNALTNAIKFINETSVATTRVLFDDCRFYNIGRMGIEIQNNVGGGSRYTQITVRDSWFYNVGALNSGYGMGISLSGLGDGVFIRNCKFDTCPYAAMELAGGVNNSIFLGNTIKNCASPLEITGAVIGSNNQIISNTCDNQCTGSMLIYAQTNLNLISNYFNMSGYIIFYDVTATRSMNNAYITAQNVAVAIQTSSYTSSDNQFVNDIMSNAGSAINLVTFETYGSGVTDTVAIGCEFDQAPGGVLYAGLNGAQAPTVYLCKDQNKNTLNTVPPLTEYYSLYSQVPNNSFGGAYTTGNQITPTAPIIVNKLGFWKQAGDANTSHSLGLWTDGGTLLTSVSTSGEPSSGWVFAPIPTQIFLSPSTNYRVGVLTPAGANFAYSATVFPIVNGVVTLDSGATVAGGSLTFPTNLNSASEYFADIGYTLAQNQNIIVPACKVAQLPAAVAALEGAAGFVTDQSVSLPAFGGTLTGGGTLGCPCWCSGSAWLAG